MKSDAQLLSTTKSTKFIESRLYFLTQIAVCQHVGANKALKPLSVDLMKAHFNILWHIIHTNLSRFDETRKGLLQNEFQYWQKYIG